MNNKMPIEDLITKKYSIDEIVVLLNNVKDKISQIIVYDKEGDHHIYDIDNVKII